MTEQLPTGWVKTTLGEITAPSRERALPSDFPDVPYVGLEHVESQTMKLLGHGYAREVRSSCMQFSKDDVLYGKMRPYLNKVWVAQFDGLCSAEFLVFPKSDALHNPFLAAQLNAEDFVTFANEQVSGERPRVDFEKLSHFPVLLPPLAEQERIVAKLNVALSRGERAERAARRALERLKRYRTAVLQAGISGELTRAWREIRRKIGTASETGEALLQSVLASYHVHQEESELLRLRTTGKAPNDNQRKYRYFESSQPLVPNLPKLPKEWAWAAVGQIGEVRLGRQRSPQHHTGDHMRPYLRVANVFEDRIDVSDVMRMNFTPREFETYRLEEGDILLNEGQSLELVGRPAMFRGEVKDCCFQNTLVRFRSGDAVNRFYALIVFRAYLQNRRFQKIAKITTNLAHLGADRFANLEFPLPSLAEQAEIVHEVGRRFTAADQLASALDRQLKHARVARESLLGEAFAGSLTPQYLYDEPASALLDRIRAARETEAEKPRDKRMPKTKPAKKRTLRRPLLTVLKESGNPMTPEELFQASGHAQESVDRFFAELRELTDSPAKITEERNTLGQSLLKATL